MVPAPPPRSTLACLVALALCVCILHREVLFQGAVYHMDDAADGYYPGHIVTARAFAAGELPTWERGSWCGWPLVVDPYNGVFYPPNVLYYLIGAARGLGYSIALHIFLGGAGMWLLLRRRGLAPAIALFGGLAYELSSFGVVRIRHVIFVQMMGWLPWILVGVEGWLQTRRRRELLLVALATGLALVAGALSIGHFAALVIAGYTAARVATQPRALHNFGALALAAILGALLAAVQIAPTLAHLPYSPRALGSDYRFASSYAWPHVRYLFTLLVPDLFGGEDRRHYVGAPNHWELCGWYVGAVCVLLAPLGLQHRRKESIVLGLLVLLAIGLAFGDAGPIHRFFYLHVPLYAALRCPARALLMGVLALPILGSHGLAALLERRRSTLALAAIIAGAVAIAAALTFSATSAWLHFAGILGGGILLTLIARWLPHSIAAAAFALLLAVDLLLTNRGYLQPQPARYPSGMERFAAVEWLRDHAEGARFVNDPDGPFRLHNVGMVLGLENASGYDSVAIWRYVDFLYLIAHGHPYPHQSLRDDFAGIGVHNLGSRLLDLMNVRWLLAGHPPPGPQGARWVERFRPSPGPSFAPAAEFEPYWDRNMRVFENTTVLPRAFVVYRAEVPGSDAALAARLVDPEFDPSAVALLEEPAPIPPRQLDRPYTPARIVSAGRHEMVFEADLAAPGVLIVGDAHYPGWRVTVDGAQAKLLRADWAFRGVALPAGHHRVVMSYASRPVAIGSALALLGALGLLGLVTIGRHRHRPSSVV